jgi:hypothetical protein
MCTKADRDELLAELRRVGKLVDGSPRVADMREHGEFSPKPYYNEFESWSNVLEVVGFEKNHNQNTSRENLIQAIHDLANSGRPVTAAAMDEYGKFCAVTYYNHFETYNEAVKEAGYEPVQRQGSKVKLTCEICESDFKVVSSNSEQRFCSSECFGKYRTGKYTGSDHPNYVERVEKKCENCGELFERVPWRVTDREQFCSQMCYNDWKAEQSESFDYGRGWNEDKREKVRKKYDRKCQSCGITEQKHKQVSGKKLAVHHIIPAKQIEDEQARNAVTNLIPLCISCHNDWEGIPLKPKLIRP